MPILGVQKHSVTEKNPLLLAGGGPGARELAGQGVDLRLQGGGAQADAQVLLLPQQLPLVLRQQLPLALTQRGGQQRRHPLQHRHLLLCGVGVSGMRVLGVGIK